MATSDASLPAPQRSPCPVATTLDLVGDKWTLLVVRDLLLFGPRTYSELLRAPEGIPTNILADRLKKLEQAGIVRKEPYQERPVRYTYRLTEMGRELRWVLRAMMRWAGKYIPGTLSEKQIRKLYGL